MAGEPKPFSKMFPDATIVSVVSIGPADSPVLIIATAWDLYEVMPETGHIRLVRFIDGDGEVDGG